MRATPITRQSPGPIQSDPNSYRLYRNQLVQTEAHLDSILKSARDTLDILLSLTESFKAVEEQTTEFRAQCEEILVDQKKTTRLAEDITENLQYYNYLEPITKRLNAPGAGNLIRRAEFSDMLANIDTCLDYMQAHVRISPIYDQHIDFSSRSKRKHSPMVPNTVSFSRALSL
jgi:conserved oligomeric Golgi complex subunit 3